MDLGHEYDLVLGILEEAIGYFPKFATAHRRRGELLVAKLDDQAAVPEFAKAIRLNPPDAHAHSKRGLAHWRWAMATLRLGCGISTKRSASSPRLVAFLYYRGQIRRNACDFKGARADFDEAVRLSTGDPGNYYERALVLKRLGRRVEAIGDLEMYLDRDRTRGYRDHHEEQRPPNIASRFEEETLVRLACPSADREFTNL